MNTTTILQRWLLAALLAIFISACATTQEELMDGDGAPPDDSTQGQLDGSQAGGDSTSADATGIDDGSDGAATSIVDDSPLTAREAIEQSEGVLATRTARNPRQFCCLQW